MKSPLPTLRSLVSLNKKRFQDEKYDLDLSCMLRHYLIEDFDKFIDITDRIIAMGFPSENMEGMYRNNMKKVQSFLEEKHKGHYMVF